MTIETILSYNAQPLCFCPPLKLLLEKIRIDANEGREVSYHLDMEQLSGSGLR